MEFNKNVNFRKRVISCSECAYILLWKNNGKVWLSIQVHNHGAAVSLLHAGTRSELWRVL